MLVMVLFGLCGIGFFMLILPGVQGEVALSILTISGLLLLLLG